MREGNKGGFKILYIPLKTEPLQNISAVTILQFCSSFSFPPQLLCALLSSLTWNFVCLLLQTFNILRTLLLPSYLVTYVAQLFALLGEKAGKILGSLRLESRGLLLSVLRRKLQPSQAQRTT